MRLYCQKLDKVAPDLPVVERDLISEHGRLLKSKFYNLKRFYFNDGELDKYLNLVPELKPYYLDAAVTDIRLLLPHIHTGEPHTIINFYSQTAGEKTTFWDGDVQIDNRYIQDEGNGYWNVNHELVEPVKSYTAQKGDVWLLDPLAPHSVLPDIGPEKEIVERMITGLDKQIMRHAIKNTRKLVQLFFNIPPEEALERIYGKAKTH